MNHHLCEGIWADWERTSTNEHPFAPIPSPAPFDTKMLEISKAINPLLMYACALSALLREGYSNHFDPTCLCQQA